MPARARPWQPRQRRSRVVAAVGAAGPFSGGGQCLSVQGMIPVGRTGRALPLFLSPPSPLPPTSAIQRRQRWRLSLARCRALPRRQGGYHHLTPQHPFPILLTDPRRWWRAATRPVAATGTSVRVARRHQAASLLMLLCHLCRRPRRWEDAMAPPPPAAVVCAVAAATAGHGMRPVRAPSLPPHQGRARPHNGMASRLRRRRRRVASAHGRHWQRERQGRGSLPTRWGVVALP